MNHDESLHFWSGDVSVPQTVRRPHKCVFFFFSPQSYSILEEPHSSPVLCCPGCSRGNMCLLPSIPGLFKIKCGAWLSQPLTACTPVSVTFFLLLRSSLVIPFLVDTFSVHNYTRITFAFATRKPRFMLPSPVGGVAAATKSAHFQSLSLHGSKEKL